MNHSFINIKHIESANRKRFIKGLDKISCFFHSSNVLFLGIQLTPENLFNLSFRLKGGICNSNIYLTFRFLAAFEMKLSVSFRAA